MKIYLPSMWLLSTIALASPFAMNVLNPALPDVVRALDSEINIVQLTITLYLFTLGVSQLLCGALADRFGRRPLMLVGMVVNLAGSLLAALAPNIEVVIAGRVLQALGGGATLVLVRTMILDAHGRDQAGKYLSYINMAIAVAQTIAPTIGGYLNHYFDWRAIFYFSFGLNLMIALLMLRRLQETSTDIASQKFSFSQLFNQYISVFRSRIYMAYAMTGAFSTCGYMAFMTIMPYIYVDGMGGTSAEYGNWFLLVSTGYFSGSLFASHLTVKLGLDRMISVGILLALPASALLFGVVFMGSIVAGAIFSLMGIVTFSRGLILPNAQSGAISSISHARGTASGMMGFMQLMMAATVSQLMPVLYGWGVEYVFGVIFLLLFMVFLMHRIALRCSVVCTN